METEKITHQKELNKRINELRKENKRLKEVCKNYKLLLDDSKQGVWEWDVTNDLYRIFTSSKESYSYNFDGESFSLETWKKMIHPEDVDKAVHNLQSILDKKKEVYENMYRLQTKSGDYRWVLSKGKAIKSSEGDVIMLKGSHTDITEKLELEQKLFDLSFYDSLTKLSNKEKLIIDFNELVRSQSTHSGIAFFFIDIDNFGYINNLLGYNEGNKVIKRFSQFLSSRYYNHIISRFSVDEFIVIYQFEGSIEEVKMELEQLLQTLRTKCFINLYDIRLSVSIGVAIYKEHGQEFYDLLKNSDTALYYAKENGKDRYEIYHEHMELKVFNYIDLVNQIRVGMKKEEFQMYYQPIIDAKKGNIVSLEALIRWKHTRNGFISPNTFIPIAENSDIMKTLEKWIIEEVFSQIKTWIDEKELPLFISINLSSKGLLERNLVEFLKEMLDKYQICPEKVEFEVTETSLIKNLNNSLEILNDLRKIGFRIVLDDFGKGYSSLNYLKKLPLNKVKLDKSFIDEMETSEKDQLLVKSIIALSHSLDLKVVAEGIERLKQKDLLESMGCDYIQGYYYGRPMPVNEIEEWLSEKYPKKTRQDT